MKDAKKEDQEYIDSMLEKHNLSSPKHDNEYYRKLDNSILQWCPFVLVLFIIISILLSSISGSNTHIISFIFIVIFIFAVLYIIFSFLFWIVGLLSKKTKNYKFNLIVKLLISIILAILITYTVSTPICAGCGGSTPTNATTQLLKFQINNPGAESCTDPVTFSRTNKTLTAEDITRYMGLDPEQVIFANPENIEIFDTSTSNSQILNYNGTSNKKVAMCVLCANGKIGLEQALQANGINNTTITSTIEEELLCAVYPRRTSAI